jgi:HK97 family phage prohead protease
MDISTAVSGGTEFRIFTGLLKTSRSNDGKLRLHGVASSTTKDLHGDVMLASAIEDMERAANNNLTIFLNHSYNVPEDVGGSVEKAKSLIRGVDQDGNPNIDLNFDILINDSNARAVQTFEAIERGTKLGLSIGAMIPDGGAKRNKDGSYLIEHVDLLETSIVGIPANPRSWVEYAVKALKGKNREQVIPLGEPTLTLDSDSNSYTITGSLSGVEIVNDVEPEETESVEPEILEEAVEPEVQDAQVTIIQIDTGDDSPSDDSPSSQEAPESAPEAEVGGLLDETADGDDAALGDDVTRSVEPDAAKAMTEVVEMLRQTTRELMETKAALVEANVAKTAAETAKEQALAERNQALVETKALLDKVANSPLVRRAVVREAQSAFSSRFEGIYGEEILRMLEKRNEE